jgi:hypothetical protein
VAGSCECGDEPSGSSATELVRYVGSYITCLKEQNNINHKTVLTTYYLHLQRNHSTGCDLQESPIA